MHQAKISRIQIREFFGKHDVSIDTVQPATFLIGYNGTGKTSLINLIRAALTVDVPYVLGKRFKSIKITFDIGARSRPFLLVERADDHDEVTFSFFEKSRSKEPTLFAAFDHSDIYEHFDEFHEATFSPEIESFQYHLGKYYKVHWLSITRGTMSPHFRRSRVNPIDAKLEEISISLTEYISQLHNKGQEINSQFNHKFFLSLLDSQKTDLNEYVTLDKVREKSLIQDIFREMRIPEKTHSRITNSFFQQLPDVDKNTTNFDAEEFVLLSNMMRLHRMVEAWNEKQQSINDLNHYLTTYIDIINSQFLRKKMHIDARNRIQFENENGDKIDIFDLSSGEKQLLILLGDALVRNQSPTIYLADEPELSLHIEWQENLVDNIIRVNPSAQIFFATHSPDIVSRFSSGAIRMDDLF